MFVNNRGGERASLCEFTQQRERERERESDDALSSIEKRSICSSSSNTIWIFLKDLEQHDSNKRKEIESKNNFSMIGTL